MAQHHGLNELSGLHAFCHYDHADQRGNRFGRLFRLPPLYNDPEGLKKLGEQEGPMDGGTTSNRTDSVPVGQVFFGQFIDHDTTLDVTSSFSSVAAPEATPNVRTPTLDLDCVYGLGPEAHPYLFYGNGQFAGIKLFTGADGTAAIVTDSDGTEIPQPPEFAAHDLSRSPDGTAIIGDPRNDENRVVSQLQLAMIRFHNNVVDTLHNDPKNKLEGKKLYEYARELVTWHYQWVVINDFLVKLCGAAVVSDILGNGRRFYCTNGDEPFIPIEFSVAAYRFGHSMVPQKIQIQQGQSAFELFGTVFGRGFSPLMDERAIVDWHELLETSENRNVQAAEKLDTQLATGLLKLPFIPEDDIQSLASRNLLRGQTFLLPSGENIARAIQRPDSEIDNVSQSTKSIASEAADLTNGTPLWFYILREAKEIGRETNPGEFEPGEGLGPVGARIVAETMIGLIELDSRSYLAKNRNWSPAQGVGVDSLGEMLTYQAS
jgi:hypothetical protein